VSNTLVVIFGIASALASSYWVLLLLRGLVGFGIAGSHVAVSWLSEFAPAQKRGKLLLAMEVFFRKWCCN